MIGLMMMTALAADVTSDGELRYILTLPPDFAVDAEGTMVGQGPVLDQRLRAGVHVAFGDDLTAHTEWDFGHGQLLGDTWDIPGDADERHREAYRARSLDGIQPRRLSIAGPLGPVDLEAGLMTSKWGLGMLAHDGASDPLFGRVDQGDRVLRVRGMVAPWGESHLLPLFFVGAFDVVYADDLARLTEGQVAMQGVAAVVLRDLSEGTYGLYAVHRRQTEEDGVRKTRAWVGDVYVDRPLDIDGSTLRLSVEAAGIAGRTSRATTYNSRESIAVQSAGVAAQAVFTPEGDRVAIHMRGGWASGDGNPDDDVTHDFTFDREFDVGMVMYPEFQGAVEAGLSALVTDPANVGQPPDGWDALTTEGAFKRATYFQPAVVIQAADPLELRLGATLAWATAPQANPFYSARAGGVATSHLDERSDGYDIGTELNWAVRVHGGEAAEDWFARPELLVQGGHAFLSAAAVGSGDRRLDLGMVTVRGRW